MSETVVPTDVLRDLLHRTGWAPAGASEDVLPGIVEAYQAFHGLRVDGWAGPKTLASLEAPRFCALPDHFTGPGLAARGINRWGKRRLGIEIRGSLGRLTDEVFREGVMAGFGYIADVCDLTFDLVQDNGDIVVTTGQIDGPSGTLAWSELPPRDNHQHPLTQKYDISERWNVTVPLDAVVAHEGCHACGLGHTQVPNQLMNPTLSRFKTPQPAWDIPELVKRYGEPKQNPAPQPTPSGPAVIRLDLQSFEGALFVNGNRITF